MALELLPSRMEFQRNGESLPSACRGALVSSRQESRVASADSVESLSGFAFVYGTLKKGFGNYWLMEELMQNWHARFVGAACTTTRYPLVCGPFQVPFLLDFPASGHYVRGELYQVDARALARLDELEGVANGHYERRPLLVTVTGLDVHDAQQLNGTLEPSSVESLAVKAEAYFGSPNYSRCMAMAPHIPCFTEEEASKYIRRKDRPQNRTFLEHISAWIQAEGFAKFS